MAAAQAKIASDAGLSADQGNAIWASTRAVIETYYRSPPTIRNIREDFAKVANWAKTYHIAPSRIVLGEFGVLRPGGPKETVINYARISAPQQRKTVFPGVISITCRSTTPRAASAY